MAAPTRRVPVAEQLEPLKKHPVAAEVYKLATIVFGALIFAVGLEGFLVPNDFLDGGVVGIAIIASQYVDLPVGTFIAIGNVPFVILAWVMVGHRNAIRSGVGIATLSIATLVLHHMDPFTDESWLALICGGAMIGSGVGLALRQGGALDGTEVLASILATRTQFSVGQVILFINLVIFTVAGFAISWESAMLSGVLFYVVVKDLVDKIAHGDSGAVRVRVSTNDYARVASMLADLTGRPVIVDQQQRWYADGPGEQIWVIHFTSSRMEEATIIEAIEEIDPHANVSFSHVTNLHGPRYESIGTDAHH